jgi:hypothetical protein
VAHVKPSGLPPDPVPRRRVHAEQASSLPSFCTLQKPQYHFGGSFLAPPPPLLFTCSGSVRLLIVMTVVVLACDVWVCS